MATTGSTSKRFIELVGSLALGLIVFGVIALLLIERTNSFFTASVAAGAVLNAFVLYHKQKMADACWSLALVALSVFMTAARVLA